ncbi:MAG: SOS response-associated peptidase family protein [Lachnospiraceae bacterium]
MPTNTAPIIEKTEHGLQLSLCKWGFPLQKGKNLVINARAETVLDKPSFSNGIWYHRIVIPASGFYEWNRLREKNTFTRSDASVLYLAGFCDWFDNERRFVILTTCGE